MKRHPARMVAAIALMAAGILMVIGIAHAVGRDAQDRDFLAYWASGKQLVRGANPYDAGQVLALEKQAGFSGDKPNMLLNWPLAFFLTYPVGLLRAETGLMVWLLLEAVCLVVSVRLIRRVLPLGESRLHLVGYAFAPVVACLMAGQLGIFMLLGVAAFLRFHRARPEIAGAALILCAIKPHLFVPLAAVLVIWSVRERAWRLLGGLAAATLGSLALAWWLDPHAWGQYAAMMNRTAEVRQDFIPCLSQLFRLAVNRQAVWLQFVPVGVGTVWGIGYYWRNRARWNWLEQGLLLLLVSELVAPHAWFTDETVLLPAVIAGLDRAEGDKRATLLFLALAGVALMEVFAGVKLTSAAYVWTAPAWLLYYLYATRGPAEKAECAATATGV